IAASHVVTAINQYLPYQSRMKSYSTLLRDLEELMLQAELRWHSISEGQLSAEEINEARFEIRGVKQKSLNKHIQTTIPTDMKLQEKAEQQALNYFKTFYVT
ncbi:MAG: hypothetical protein RLP12_00135, partial [Ekhidna sp.]